MSLTIRIGLVGFCLIAICYGFARFAFGMFLPQINEDLDLGTSISGAISGASFASYCVAIIASAILTERFGARAVAVGAALVAAVGMAGIALAPSPLILAVAVVVAGSSTGLASPPMAAAVVSAVREGHRNLTNTMINSGVSGGVALSAPIALAMTGHWRLTFAAFAALALVLAITAAMSLPDSRDGSAAGALPPMTAPVARLLCASFLMGAASTAVWSFGGQLVSVQLDWGPTGTGLLWSCIGTGGLAGALAGTLSDRFGLDRVHLAFLYLMTTSILAVGLGLGPIPVLVGGAIFGAAYVTLTGVYLVWGTSALPDRPATGLMVGFLAIAVGQTIGAPLFGFLMAGPGAKSAVMCFAAVALLAGAFRASDPIDRATA